MTSSDVKIPFLCWGLWSSLGIPDHADCSAALHELPDVQHAAAVLVRAGEDLNNFILCTAHPILLNQTQCYVNVNYLILRTKKPTSKTVRISSTVIFPSLLRSARLQLQLLANKSNKENESFTWKPPPEFCSASLPTLDDKTQFQPLHWLSVKDCPESENSFALSCESDYLDNWFLILIFYLKVNISIHFNQSLFNVHVRE